MKKYFIQIIYSVYIQGFNECNINMKEKHIFLQRK